MPEIFVFYVFYCNLKEKDHIRRIINSKKKRNICKSGIIILIYRKLGLIGPVKQDIKLPSSNSQTNMSLLKTISSKN